MKIIKDADALALYADKRLYDLYMQLGGWASWKLRDFSGANDYYAKALKVRPWAQVAWQKFIWSSLSDSLRTRLSWWKYKLGKANRAENVKH